MSKFILILILIQILIGCSTETEEALLSIPDSFSFMLEQRTSRVIEGSEESILVKIGDITKRKVEVLIQGESEEGKGEIYLDKVMQEGDRGKFDYHGTSYTIEIEDLINQLIGADNAQIAIYKGSGEEDFQPEVE